jgi:AraC family transcriptional regulator
MLTETQTGHALIRFQAGSRNDEAIHETQALCRERKWRQPEHCAVDDIAVSRWIDLSNSSRYEEAETQSDRYFVGVALKTTRIKLSRGPQIIFDGIMPEGTLYISAPSKQLSAQFDAPFDFLHFHISAGYFSAQRSARFIPNNALNDLVLLRNSFAEQLAKVLTENGDATDCNFARCIGQALAMYVARLKFPQNNVNALPKWRLKRVKEYVKANFDRCIGLSDLAKVAGLSRMHFAAQFRAATGYRPREYLLHQRIEHAKSLLSTSDTSLAEIALSVGFCTQSHFSTVFKRVTGDTPGRWRCSSKDHLLRIQTVSSTSAFDDHASELRPVA